MLHELNANQKRALSASFLCGERREGQRFIMQCPFLFKTRHSYCKTGALGLMVPYRQDYKKFCCNSSYHRCQVYQANTGVGDLEKIREMMACRIVKSEQAAMTN